MADRKIIETLIQNIGDLPTIPEVFFTVNKMLSNPRTSAIDVSNAVSNDQVISSKILKIVNSAFYSFASQVNTVPHAISVLGFNSVKNIILTTSVLSALNLKISVKEFSITDFWKHSVAVGAIAKLIAAEAYPQKQEEAFVIGLLHDIGKLILAICSAETFEECLNFAIKKNCLFINAEQEIIGIDHTNIAFLINKKWNLPQEIINVITQHHSDINPANKEAKMLAIIKLADILSRGLQFGHACDYSMPIIEDEAFELLQLSPLKLSGILTKSTEALQNSMIFISSD